MKMFSVLSLTVLASLGTQPMRKTFPLRLIQPFPCRTSKAALTTWMWMSRQRLFVAGLENGSVEVGLIFRLANG